MAKQKESLLSKLRKSLFYIETYLGRKKGYQPDWYLLAQKSNEYAVVWFREFVNISRVLIKNRGRYYVVVSGKFLNGGLGGPIKFSAGNLFDINFYRIMKNKSLFHVFENKNGLEPHSKLLHVDTVKELDSIVTQQAVFIFKAKVGAGPCIAKFGYGPDSAS